MFNSYVRSPKGIHENTLHCSETPVDVDCPTRFLKNFKDIVIAAPSPLSFFGIPQQISIPLTIRGSTVLYDHDYSIYGYSKSDTSGITMIMP